MHEEQKDEEYMYNEITGGKGKKSVMSLLNKSKVSKFEMDELFCEE